jgi:protein arginine kinase activator
MNGPHKCDSCGEKATVFITLIKNGQQVSLNFCQHHAEAAGVFGQKPYGLVGDKEPADLPSPKVVACPNCHCTHQDFNQKGRFGCGHCYTTFTNDLKIILKHIQPGLTHKGKIPHKTPDVETVKHRLQDLNLQLSEAVKAEHYEEAAQVRDEIAHWTALLPPQGG